MTSTIGYEFGDGVLIPIPFTDLSAARRRPAIVISSADYHRDHPDVIVMALTSRAAARNRAGEFAVQGWRRAGLLKPSVVKPILATVDRALVDRKLGRLEAADRASTVLVAQANRRILSPVGDAGDSTRLVTVYPSQR